MSRLRLRDVSGYAFLIPYLALFVTHDEFWRRLCVEIDRPGWATDQSEEPYSAVQR